MTTISHESRHSTEWLRLPDVWGSLAISMMWLAVLFDSVFGPNLVSSEPSGQTTTIPSGVLVALFACIGSAWVARYAFRGRRD